MIARSIALRGGRGFTLVEMMVAVACLAIIMIALMNLFKTLATVWIVGHTDIEMRNSMSAAADRMGRHVRSAIPPYHQDRQNEINFIGLDQGTGTLGNTVGDELKFYPAEWSSDEGVSSNWGTEIQRMYYWLKKNTANDTRIQIEKRTSKVSDTILALSVASDGGGPMAYSIADLDYDYRDIDGTWSTTWDAQLKNRLPALVRITMKSQKGARSRSHVFIARPHARQAHISK